MARKLIYILACVLLLSALLCPGALAVTVEQAQAMMPEIDVYLYEDAGDLTDLTAEDVTATLDGSPLTVRELTRSEQGIFYVYMLDVSGSIPAAHFSAAKAAVLTAYSRLREQDMMALIAFGDEVTVCLRGGESKSRVTEALDALTPDNANTKFYEAMEELVEMVAATEDMRRVAVVISDGDDSAASEDARTQLETTLLESGVSVSALCIDSVSEQSVEDFREIIEISGGKLYTFGADEADEVLESLLDRLDGGWLLCMEADSNLADGRTAELSMTFGDGEPVVCPVTLDRWTPDTEPPMVRSAEYDAAGPAITVTYSEPVSGADALTAYTLSAAKGPSMVISSVEALDAVTYKLTLSAPAGEDEALSLAVSGVKDLSMEQNPLEPYTAPLTSAAPARATPEPVKAPPLMDLSTMLILGGSVLLLAAAGVLIFRLSKKKTGDKPPKEKKPGKKPQKPAEKTDARFIFEEKDKK